MKITKNARQEEILGFKVHFHNYSELINLFEEIFIYEAYRFESANSVSRIIDGGSNIGMSILYFKSLYVDCQVMAFEPSKENFSLLKKNIEVNGIKGIELYNVALNNLSTTVSISRDVINSSLNWRISNNSDGLESQLIEAKALSEFMIFNDFYLKLDVEGAEELIIENLFTTGKLNSIKEMIIEFHPSILRSGPENLIKRLTAFNFEFTIKEDVLHHKATEIMLHACKPG